MRVLLNNSNINSQAGHKLEAVRLSVLLFTSILHFYRQIYDGSHNTESRVDVDADTLTDRYLL